MKRVQTIDKAIGARLRAFRLQRQLTQTALATPLGVTFQQIQKYENGVNRISSSTLVKLCELLNVKPEQILGNGHGVFHSEPDVLALFHDRDMVRMLLEIGKLPAVQRRAVTLTMVAMVRAFQPRLK
ncbi:MAG TPA: helix-turn-helix domain-containing protein [Xanthobacteraceae bacterium]|jgi:transcriptional regulator with XRE-family HTH domain